MNKKLIEYSFSVIKNDLLRRYGVFTKRCVNTPYILSFAVTERCNARCSTCDLWKNPDQHELSTHECLSLIRQLHEWSPRTAINFTGGEPFVRSDFGGILELANSLGLYTTVITNGIAFNRQECDRIIATGVDYINFSINSIAAEIHDRYKGTEGLHEKIISATKYIKTRDKRIKICYSPVITADTYKTLNDFVFWALESGADIIDFIPILSSFGHNVRVDGPLPASSSHPLMQIEDLQILDKQLDLLIEKKKKGFPIVTPIAYLEKMKLYYRNPDSVPPKRACQLGFRNLHILPNGDAKLCYFYPPAGNVKNQTIKEIWSSKKAAAQRIDLLECNRPCMCSAFREYGFSDKISIFLMRSGLNRKVFSFLY